MEALNATLLAVGVAMAILLLVWLKMEYSRICRHVSEDQGWYRLWHERIMDESNGIDGPGPP